ncbi:MAG: DUF6065 family protein [Gemmatimonadaceae bacterium]
MQLIAYKTEKHPPAIRPAEMRRQWMDATSERFAYRCLPLTMANQHGWELLCPATCELLWSGRPGRDAIQIVPADKGDAWLPISDFGHGVVTFRTGHLFRTDATCDFYVTGPPNTPKDGLAPLTGIVESSWLPFTFTMNWIFTRPGTVVRFDQGEPFCFMFPIKRDILPDVSPLLADIGQDPVLAAEYAQWRERRSAHRCETAMGVPASIATGVQPLYMQGKLVSGQRTAFEHRTTLRVKPFVPMPSGIKND